MGEGSGAGSAGQPSQDNKPERKSDLDQKQNNKKKDGKRKPFAGSSNKSSSFKGAVADLNGHVFELGSEMSKNNQYNRTVEKISNYVARKYGYSGDISRLIREEKALASKTSA